MGAAQPGPALASAATLGPAKARSLNSEQQKEVLLALWRPWRTRGLLQENPRGAERIWAYPRPQFRFSATPQAAALFAKKNFFWLPRYGQRRGWLSSWPLWDGMACEGTPLLRPYRPIPARPCPLPPPLCRGDVYRIRSPVSTPGLLHRPDRERLETSHPRPIPQRSQPSLGHLYPGVGIKLAYLIHRALARLGAAPKPANVTCSGIRRAGPPGMACPGRHHRHRHPPPTSYFHRGAGGDCWRRPRQSPPACYSRWLPPFLAAPAARLSPGIGWRAERHRCPGPASAKLKPPSMRSRRRANADFQDTFPLPPGLQWLPKAPFSGRVVGAAFCSSSRPGLVTHQNRAAAHFHFAPREEKRR